MRRGLEVVIPRKGRRMNVHRQGGSRGPVYNNRVAGWSLDFKADRVENRMGLEGQDIPGIRDGVGDQVRPSRQQGSHCSTHIPDAV